MAASLRELYPGKVVRSGECRLNLLVLSCLSIVAIVIFVGCAASKDSPDLAGHTTIFSPEATSVAPLVAAEAIEPIAVPARVKQDVATTAETALISMPIAPQPTVEVVLSEESKPEPEPVLEADAENKLDAIPGSTPAPVMVHTPTPVPVATPASTPEIAPEPVLTPEPEPLPTAEPAPVPTIEPTPAPLLVETIDQFGFLLSLDRGTAVRTTGWTGAEPDESQGTLSFNDSGINTILIWGPQQERTPVTFLADTYNILKGSQPTLSFDPISDGEITVDGQQGVYGGFKTVDVNGATVGGGLIGTWGLPRGATCLSAHAYRRGRHAGSTTLRPLGGSVRLRLVNYGLPLPTPTNSMKVIEMSRFVSFIAALFLVAALIIFPVGHSQAT